MDYKNISKLINLLLYIVLLFIFSCSTGNGETTGNNNLNDYDVYLLTGKSLDTRDITINGLTIDMSTIDSINNSVQRIIKSSDNSGIVYETINNIDHIIDFTGSTVKVPDTYYGLNMQIASKQFLSMPKYKELIKNIKVDIIRFPGGQERVKFDKNASIDAEWELGHDSEYQFLLTGKDVENYINLCSDLDIYAEPEINIYNNDAVMAENFISYIVNDLGYDLKYISAGNEPDINAISNWTYLEADNIDKALGNYMSRYKEYYSGIKSVKNDVNFVLCEIGSWQSSHLESYLDTLLSQINGKNPGVISVHWYMLGDWGQSALYPDYPLLEHMVINSIYENRITYLSNIINTMKVKRDQYAPKAKLFIGEWGVTWSATDDSTKIMDRLSTLIFNAEVMEYSKILGFDSMQFFSISDPKNFYPWNPALIAVDGENFTLRPQYYLYLVYKYLWGNRIVNVTDNQNENYSIYASMDSKHHYIMLINRTDSTNYTKTVNIITGKGSKKLSLTLNAKSVTIIRF